MYKTRSEFMCLSTRQEKARQTTRPRSDIRSSIHHARHQMLADFTFNGVTFTLVHDVSGAETAATPGDCSCEHDFKYKKFKILKMARSYSAGTCHSGQQRT